MQTHPNPLAGLQDATLLKTDGLIGGDWVSARDESARFAVADPATGQVLAKVANLGPWTAPRHCRRPKRPGRCGAPRRPQNGRPS